MFLAKTCTNPHQFTKSAPVCIVSPCKISAPRLLLKPAPEPNWKIWKYRGLLKAFFRGEVRCHPLWSMSLPIQSWAYGPCIKAQHQRDLHSAVLPVICLVPSASLPMRVGGARNHWNWRLVAFACHGFPTWATPCYSNSRSIRGKSESRQHVNWNPACCGEFPLPKPSVRSNKARCRWTSSGSQVSSPNEPTSVEFGGLIWPSKLGQMKICSKIWGSNVFQTNSNRRKWMSWLCTIEPHKLHKLCPQTIWQWES